MCMFMHIHFLVSVIGTFILSCLGFPGSDVFRPVKVCKYPLTCEEMDHDVKRLKKLS